MRKSIVVGGIVAILAIGGTAFAWFWFSGGSGEPSTELTTPTIAGQTTTTQATTTTPDDGETTTTVADTTGGAFVIQADESLATFTLDEVLRGEPKTVVGTTSELAGQFVLDLSDLSQTQFSDIVVNARTFTTDSSTRDRAIRGPIILNSATDEFEFITFVVTDATGLDGSAEVGDTFEFTLIGDLTIKGVTNEVEFDVTATLVDDSTVEGIAETEVLRSDYGIGIPSVASVADVTDEVQLQLDFVASSA